MEIFIDTALLMVISAVLAIGAKMLRQPIVVSYMLTGILIGPAVLNIVHGGETMEIMSKFGIALLLFIVGLGLNANVIKEVGKASVIVGLAQVIVGTIFGAGIFKIAGLSLGHGILLGLAFSFSSTIIILKLLADKKQQHQLYGKLSIGVLLIQDIVAAAALLVVAASTKGGLSLVDLASLLLKGGLLVGLVLVASKYIIKPLESVLASSQELLFLFALGWAFGVAALFYKAGFSIEVGALFAGVMLASTNYASEIASRMRPLRDFFLIVFFISLGSTLNLASTGKIIVPAILISLSIIILKPFLVMILFGIMGYTKNTSFKAGLLQSQISEFSLILVLLATTSIGVSQDMLSLTTMVAIITITLSTYIINYSPSLYKVFERHLNIFERKKVKYEQHIGSDYDAIVVGYHKGGREFIKALKHSKFKVLVVDYDPDVIDELERKKINFLYGDITEPDLFDELDISKINLVVSTLTAYEPTNTMLKIMRRKNPSIMTILNTDNPVHAKLLYSHGADYVMLPHVVGGKKIAEFLDENGLNEEAFVRHRKRHLRRLNEDIKTEESSATGRKIGHLILKLK